MVSIMDQNGNLFGLVKLDKKNHYANIKIYTGDSINYEVVRKLPVLCRHYSKLMFLIIYCLLASIRSGLILINSERFSIKIV
jgi:hypothetical protein